MSRCISALGDFTVKKLARLSMLALTLLTLSSFSATAKYSQETISPQPVLQEGPTGGTCFPYACALEPGF